MVTSYLADDQEVLSVPEIGRGGRRKPACSQLPAPRLAPVVSACGLARPRWDKGRNFSSEGSPPPPFLPTETFRQEGKVSNIYLLSKGHSPWSDLPQYLLHILSA